MIQLFATEHARSSLAPSARRSDGLTGEADAGLRRWIAALRERLAAGDLTRLTALDFGSGVLPSGELTVRVMLADLEDIESSLAETPESRALAARRQGLLNDFRRLRTLIG